MAGNDMKDTTLQLAQELYSDGVQKNFFFFPSYLTLHLALQSSRVFKASSASSYVYARKRDIFSSCATARTHAQVRILGGGTQELPTRMTNKLQKEFGVTTTSFTPTKAMAKGGAAIGVTTRVTHVVEEKMALTLLLVFLLFLRLYCNHNRNTRKEK